MNKVTADNVIWTMLDEYLRMHKLGKKRPNYRYVKGVGMMYNPSEDADFIEYCRLVNEYKQREVNYEN